MAPDDAMT